MIACTFAACSNEDDPIPSVDPTPEAGTASLSVAMDTKSMKTKAGEESALTSLTVVVYDNAGKYLASKTNDGTEIAGRISNDEAHFEDLPAGNVKIVAYANMAGSGIDYTADMSVMAGKAFALPINSDNTITTTNLPMSRGALSVALKANKTNFYGYTDPASL
ncbi:fimbrial protein [Parabacteroides sp.]